MGRQYPHRGIFEILRKAIWPTISGRSREKKEHPVRERSHEFDGIETKIPTKQIDKTKENRSSRSFAGQEARFGEPPLSNGVDGCWIKFNHANSCNRHDGICRWILGRAPPRTIRRHDHT